METANPTEQPCETCENGCSCRSGVDPQCGHFGCWGIPGQPERCHSYEANRAEMYASLGLPLPALAV